MQAMSEEQLKAFIAKAKDDQSIQEKLRAAKSPMRLLILPKNMVTNSLPIRSLNSVKRSWKAWLVEVVRSGSLM